MCPQLKKRKCKCPSASDCRDCRRIRLRKIVVSTWRVVCRRLQTVSGVAFDLHQKAHDQSGKSTGRRSAVCPGGAGPASASGHSGHPQHVWNGNRTVKQPAVDVFAARVAPVPERALCSADTESCGRTGDHLSGVRRTCPCAECGAACL